MKNPYFFGYGSLVNCATHSYQKTARASARGWRRAWVQTAARPFSFLSVIRDPASEIAGLIAEVPGADWAALDEREAAYDRIQDSDSIDHTHPYECDISIYSVPLASPLDGAALHPILLSYLDVVLQGYTQVYGEDGAKRFFATTSGWEAQVVDDRANPIYPRAQVLSAGETDFINNLLNENGVRVVTA